MATVYEFPKHSARLPESSEFQDEAVLADHPEPYPGVYLLINDAGEVVYVGQSHDCEVRIGTHRRERTKLFTTTQLYHETDRSARLKIEGMLILSLTPQYNKALYLGVHDGRVWEIGFKAPRKGAK